MRARRTCFGCSNGDSFPATQRVNGEVGRDLLRLGSAKGERMRFIALVAVSAMVGVLMMPTAGASHLPNARCTDSGDVCVSAQEVNGERLLRIRTAAKYFSRYNVCVMPEGGSIACVQGRVRDGNGDGIWTGSVNWHERFPDAGRGAYTVRWRTGNGFRSPRVGFHV